MTSTPSKPATTFHQFSQLPAELRIHVWKYSFDHPRLIEFRELHRVGQWGVPFTLASGRRPPIEWQTKCPYPSALRACHESRDKAVDFWICRLAVKPYVFYWRPDIDVIYCNVSFKVLRALLADLKNLDAEKLGPRQMAFNMDAFGVEETTDGQLQKFPARIPKRCLDLEMLYLAARNIGFTGLYYHGGRVPWRLHPETAVRCDRIRPHHRNGRIHGWELIPRDMEIRYRTHGKVICAEEYKAMSILKD